MLYRTDYSHEGYASIPLWNAVGLDIFELGCTNEVTGRDVMDRIGRLHLLYLTIV